MLTPLQTILLGALLVLLMAGMGASLTIADFRAVLRRPRGAADRPAVAVRMDAADRVLAVQGARAARRPGDLADRRRLRTPGGTTSNLFTYFAGADVALSVSMTALSTIAAVVLMPLTLVPVRAAATRAAA